MNVLSLFDGMSCGQIALERAGIKVDNYFASEIDKHAIEVTQKNYPNTEQLGSVTDLKKREHSPKIDLLIGGSPCQDLSMLKNGDGLKGDKSSLFWEQVRLLKSLNPKYFLFENVVPRKKEWLDDINNAIGVEGVLINSDLFVCQNRPRYYWTNIPISSLPKRPDWKEQYYQYRRTYFRENKSGVCPCLTANMGTGGHNVPLKSPDKKDKLSIIETRKLQGIPEWYEMNNMANCHLYKMIGNGWTIPVIKHILSGIR